MSRSSATDWEPPQLSQEQADRVRSQLDALLTSRHFKASRRCQLLLQHVTERALEGDTHAFKERTLGVSVFGKVPDYDTNEHPVVRATAAEVRKKLAQYYQEPEHTGEIRIAMEPGCYAPAFHVPEQPPEVAPPVIAPPLPVLPAVATVESPARSNRAVLFIAVGVVLVLAAAALLSYRTRRSPLDQFWGRTSASPSVLFVMGESSAYDFRSERKQSELDQMKGHLSEEALAASRQLIPLSDLVHMPDRFMDFGDAMCLLRLATYLDKRGLTYYVRGNSSTSFNDMRDHPTVLIGAFNNEWTLRLGRPLRFWFYKNLNDPGGIAEMIRDRDHPEKTNWKLLNAWPDWNVPTDYALITRTRDRATDRMLIVAAGITHFGTVAAGEFLTRADYFAEAAAQLPAGWEKKNLQIVLQVPVIHGANGHPSVVATYVW